MSLPPRAPVPRSLAPLALLAVTWAVPAAAQDPGRSLAPRDLADIASHLVVPVHTQPDDPVGGRYGIWAAGPGYKVSFHDGFAFYPHLGPAAARHLPLRWRTETVLAGGAPLPLRAGDARWSGCRYERDLGAVVEAYDVRADGVEQTFALRSRPSRAGDLVIVGALATPLDCAPAAAAPQALRFGDGATDRVTYGRAVAVDAAGRSCAVSTAWDGARVRLVVPGAFVDRAALPLVIDPLIAPVTIHTFPSAASFLPANVAIAAIPETALDKIVIAWTQAVTLSDTDSYAMVTNRDFSGGTLIFADATTAWASLSADATWAGAGARWVVSHQRNFSSGSSHTRVYIHPLANTAVNSGTLLGPNAPSGFVDSEPALGGSRYGSAALVVAHRVHTSSGFNSVVSTQIDTVSETIGSSATFGGAFLEALDTPRITPMTHGSGGWVVAMAGTSGVRVAKVPENASGSLSTQLLVASGTGSTVYGRPDLPRFHLAGTEGRYLLDVVGTFATRTGSEDQIRTVRFDWPVGSSSPQVVVTRILAGQPAFFPTTLNLNGIEYDQVTRSHWAAAYTDGSGSHVCRFGYSGGVTETHAAPTSYDVAFARNGNEGSFVLAGRTAASNTLSIVGSDFTYPPDAVSVRYGASCAGSGVSAFTTPSFAGHEFYRLSLQVLPPGTSAIYLLSSAPANVDLTPIGMPGCVLNVMTPAISVSTVADGSGTAAVTYVLPDAPLFVGDLFSQWLYFDPTAAPLPLRAHFGSRHQVR